MAKASSPVLLTEEILKALKDKGYQFVLIKDYTLSTTPGYVSFNSFLLVPVKALPEDPAQKEIYESLDSEILTDWACAADSRVKAFIDFASVPV